ncbi:chondroitinase-B domain-containing protein [Mangrovibacterium sp.]|uniref:chondroitinase-B domain-containing protein n=1 Tax=Mangrovibacterium sp. TaxID=1961364 RepID=UPI00356648C4
MKIRNLLILALTMTLLSCQNSFKASTSLVSNAEELQIAINNASPGDEIVLADGIWKDVEIKFTGSGTADHPIVLRAETPGQVSIEGQSCLNFGGDYLVVRDLSFRNGFTPSDAVISFKLNDKFSTHCRVTNCVIENFNQPQRDTKDHWVEFWGRHNELSNCNIIGKSNSGPTVRVMLKGNENINNHHQIRNNHFGPRPRKGGPHGETIQIGDSYTSMSPCYTVVANNLFDRCNGEVEVISSKTNFNEFRNNVFYKCEGSLVMRHGNYCLIDGNYFIGDDNSDNIGGIRIVNTGHWVTNNYFYNIKGQNFRSALAIMNGIPKSPLNRYNQVTDVVVAHNTWVNCKSPWQFSVGTNVDQKDVLPMSEIRSARPIRTTFANNIIYNQEGDESPIVAYEEVDGVTFKNNIINNQNTPFQPYDGLEAGTLEMTKIADNLFIPVDGQANIETYHGFDFETISTDLFGHSRSDKNSVGAVCQTPANTPDLLDAAKYGAGWYTVEKSVAAGKSIEVSADANDLAAKIAGAETDDTIELLPGTYEINSSLPINKKITIQSKDQSNKAVIVYSGESETPAFEFHPAGNLLLKNIVLQGKAEQYAFAPLQKNMSSLYVLSIDGCEISNFNSILKAWKETFADQILVANSVLTNCENGIELAAETDDKGDYNAEFLIVENCTFNSINANVISYYRGGYDESTIGGNLLVRNCTMTNCGAKDKNGILINSRGIVNVAIANNTFKNNAIKLVALLWGAKNNTHSDNEIINSGKIVVQENIELKMMY